MIWASPGRTTPLAHTFHYRAMKADNGGKQMRDAWAIEPDAEGDLWTIPAPSRSEKVGGGHPTQKPRRLLERIIDASSSPGDVVLDPFNGSGTTGAIAVERGRRYIGIDLEQKYLDMTARRIRR